MPKREPLEDENIDLFIRKALDEARLHADEPGPLSQNWSRLAAAASLYQLTREGLPTNK